MPCVVSRGNDKINSTDIGFQVCGCIVQLGCVSENNINVQVSANQIKWSILSFLLTLCYCMIFNYFIIIIVAAGGGDGSVGLDVFVCFYSWSSLLVVGLRSCRSCCSCCCLSFLILMCLQYRSYWHYHILFWSIVITRWWVSEQSRPDDKFPESFPLQAPHFWVLHVVNSRWLPHERSACVLKHPKWSCV